MLDVRRSTFPFFPFSSAFPQVSRFIPHPYPPPPSSLRRWTFDVRCSTFSFFPLSAAFLQVSSFIPHPSPLSRSLVPGPLSLVPPTQVSRFIPHPSPLSRSLVPGPLSLVSPLKFQVSSLILLPIPPVHCPWSLVPCPSHSGFTFHPSSFSPFPVHCPWSLVPGLSTQVSSFLPHPSPSSLIPPPCIAFPAAVFSYLIIPDLLSLGHWRPA
jgi:hypothetical protein